MNILVGNNGQWYSNKELFEMINETNQKLFQQIIELQKEMKETRAIIKKYNGLYEKVHIVEKRVEQIESEQEGKRSAQENFIKWGGWIFSLITLLILMYSTFNSI